MVQNALSMETLNELRTICAWKKMSEEFPWNEEQLERNKNNVDWDLVSKNENVAWSISLLERFKNRLNWTELSQNDSNHLFQPEIIRVFADLWDWTELSRQSGWTPGLIEEFKERINWTELVDNSCLDDESFFNEAFLVKYFDYILFPEFSFKPVCRYRTSLWNKLCEETYKRLSEEVSGLKKK